MDPIVARWAALVLALVPVAARCADEPAQIVTRRALAWSHAPRRADIAAAYPAGGGGVTGEVVFLCRIERQGALTGCRVDRESPRGRGFAAAARTLLPLFRSEAEPSDPPMMRLQIRLPPPGSPELQPQAIVKPVWAAAPDGRTVLGLYPAAAREKGVLEGLVTVRCNVGDGGWLVDCDALDARPSGLGFDEAAVRAATMLRLALWAPDGLPIEGPVDLPIRMRIDASTAATPPQDIPTISSERRVIASPHWLRKPTADMMLGVYPEAAERQFLPGSVVVRCEVLPSGEMGACAIQSEAPKGWGFGPAALRLAKAFSVKPDGLPAERPYPMVDIPITFRMMRR